MRNGPHFLAGELETKRLETTGEAGVGLAGPAAACGGVLAPGEMIACHYCPAHWTALSVTHGPRPALASLTLTHGLQRTDRLVKLGVIHF